MSAKLSSLCIRLTLLGGLCGCAAAGPGPPPAARPASSVPAPPPPARGIVTMWRERRAGVMALKRPALNVEMLRGPPLREPSFEPEVASDADAE